MGSLLTFGAGIQEIIGDPTILLLVVLGVFMGIVFGSIPGLTGALGISLILPFTYTVSAQRGLAVLIAIYVGAIAGGLISAIILNIPGTPSSVVTCFDGAPMAKKDPAKALSLGTFSSLIGGIISGIFLIFVSGPMATFALQFGYWEYFAMGIMGLCIIVSLCGKDQLKGYMAASMGVLIGMVGIDTVSTVSRFTYGFWQLGAGFSSLPVLMGLFAISEIMMTSRTPALKIEKLTVKKVPLIPQKEWLNGTGKTTIVSSFIGVLIGILPGVGQTTASLLSYTSAKQNSKEPEKFGTGCAEGVVASEAANNAVCGGALIPMMAVGIPGDVITSVLLGALVLHGLQPGALLFNSNPDVVGTIFVVFLLANIVMYVMQLGLMRVFVLLLRAPMNILHPIILIACLVGAIATNNRTFDAAVLVVFGGIAYLLVNNDYPIPPLVLGFVLSQTIEKNFRTAMIATEGNFANILERPIAICLLLVGIAMAVYPTISKKMKAKSKV